MCYSMGKKHIWTTKACVLATRLFCGCVVSVVLCCLVCLESWRLSDCQLLSPHSTVQLVNLVSRPAENKILLPKHGGSQVAVMQPRRFLLPKLKQGQTVWNLQGAPTSLQHFVFANRKKQRQPCFYILLELEVRFNLHTRAVQSENCQTCLCWYTSNPWCPLAKLLLIMLLSFTNPCPKMPLKLFKIVN